MANVIAIAPAPSRVDTPRRTSAGRADSGDSFADVLQSANATSKRPSAQNATDQSGAKNPSASKDSPEPAESRDPAKGSADSTEPADDEKTTDEPTALAEALAALAAQGQTAAPADGVPVDGVTDADAAVVTDLPADSAESASDTPAQPAVAMVEEPAIDGATDGVVDGETQIAMAAAPAVKAEKPAVQTEAEKPATAGAQPAAAQTEAPVKKESDTQGEKRESADVKAQSAQPGAAQKAADGDGQSFQAKLDSAAPVDTTVAATATAAPGRAEVAQPRTETPAPQPAVPERQFATANHDRIVQSVRSELLPNGGTMKMRLDPPEIGVLQISVRIVNGTMTASFQTDNDKATQLLSHSLSQLKQSLEAQGINVDRLQVQQAPRQESAQQQGDSSQQSQREDQNGQQGWNQQQRRELLHRMERRMRNGDDPLDLIA